MASVIGLTDESEAPFAVMKDVPRTFRPPSEMTAVLLISMTCAWLTPTFTELPRPTAWMLVSPPRSVSTSMRVGLEGLGVPLLPSTCTDALLNVRKTGVPKLNALSMLTAGPLLATPSTRSSDPGPGDDGLTVTDAPCRI